MTTQELIGIANVVVIPFVSYLFRGWLKQFTHRLAALENWQMRIDQEMSAKVSREDFIRESSRTRQTLERLAEGQARIEGKMDIGTRIAASLDRIAERDEGKNG